MSIHRDSRFHRAVAKGKLDTVDSMLKKYYDINGDLLQRDIDEKNTHGKTALMIAVVSKNVEMVKLLLNHGANTDITDGNNSPLIMAVYNQSIEIVSVLLDYRANLGYRNSHDDTAFILANRTSLHQRVPSERCPYRIMTRMLWDAQDGVPTQRPRAPFNPSVPPVHTVREPTSTTRAHSCNICLGEYFEIEDLLDHVERDHNMPMTRKFRDQLAEDITFRTYETESDSDGDHVM